MIARRFVIRPLLALAALLALGACAGIETTRDAREFGQLKARFLYQGKEVAGTLTVSDGRFRQVWRDQKHIEARVPVAATYIVDLKLPGDRSGLPVTFRDVIPDFRVPAGGLRDIVIRVPRAGEPKAFEPQVLIEDAGANTQLSTTLETGKNRDRVAIATKIERPPEALVIVDGAYVRDDASPDTLRAYTCGDDCPHVYAGVDCSVYCYTCSTTAKYEGYWKANYNLCEGLSATPPPSQQSTFDILPPGRGGLHLAAATRNDGIVYPRRTAVAGAGFRQSLAPPFETRRFPDYVAKAGAYRFSAAFGAGLRRRGGRVDLPVIVADGRITEIFLRLPDRPLETLSPVLIGDTRLGVPVRRVTRSLTEDAVTITAATDDPDPGQAWIVLPLPPGRPVKSVSDARSGEALVPGRDYVLSSLLGHRVAVLRTDSGDDRMIVRF